MTFSFVLLLLNSPVLFPSLIDSVPGHTSADTFIFREQNLIGLVPSPYTFFFCVTAFFSLVPYVCRPG